MTLDGGSPSPRPTAGKGVCFGRHRRGANARAIEPRDSSFARMSSSRGPACSVHDDKTSASRLPVEAEASAPSEVYVASDDQQQ
jgi:hypothetical protein